MEEKYFCYQIRFLLYRASKGKFGFDNSIPSPCNICRESESMSVTRQLQAVVHDSKLCIAEDTDMVGGSSTRSNKYYPSLAASIKMQPF